MSGTAAHVAPPEPSADRAARPAGAVLLTLIRRELWEHRALWLAPLIVAALLAVCVAVGRLHIDVEDAARIQGEAQRVALLTIIQCVLAVPLYVAAIAAGGFYLLDCLYAERKDRSILFWKSLPVSDALTVGAKLLVALAVVPLGVFVLASIAPLLYSAILGARVLSGSLPPVLAWNAYEWLRTELVMLLVTLLAVLWYAPIAGYLLVVSAWVRRAPILVATLPVVLAPLLEWVAFGSHHVKEFINYRVNGLWWLLGVQNTRLITRHALYPVGTQLEMLDFRNLLTSIDLWLGLAVTAALVYAAVRVRRYRDDT